MAQVQRSTEGEVVLLKVELASSGTYRCEVITEAPTFGTKFGEGNMTVVDPPDSAPQLVGANSAYRLGDIINVTCSSPPSSPPALLQWFINDRTVINPRLLLPTSPSSAGHGLQTASLGLVFRAAADHFHRGQLRLRCSSSLAGLYHLSKETSVIEASYLERSQAEESRGYPFFFFSGASPTALRNGPDIAILCLLLLALTTVQWWTTAPTMLSAAVLYFEKLSESISFRLAQGKGRIVGVQRQLKQRAPPGVRQDTTLQHLSAGNTAIEGESFTGKGTVGLKGRLD